jgi:hypothetical protein
MVMLLKDIDELFDSFNSVKHAAPSSLLNDNSSHIGQGKYRDEELDLPEKWLTYLQETYFMTKWVGN